MKINNPFWSYPHVRANFDDGKCVMVLGSQREIEVPEGSQVCVIQPIAGGRSDAPGLTEPAVWTPKGNVQSLAAYQESVRIDTERMKLEADKKEMVEKKVKEAHERKQMKDAVMEKVTRVVEKAPKKVVEEKTLDMGKKLEL